MLITRNTNTSTSKVGDLTSTSKKLIFKLLEHGNNNINDLLHNEVVNRFVKTHIREQAHSSANNILGNIYNNIYNAPQPPPPPQQSSADRPTISIERSAFESYINDIVITDIKGDGYEGIRTLLYANEILEKEQKHMPMLKISVRLYCWVESKTAGETVGEFSEKRISSKSCHIN